MEVRIISVVALSVSDCYTYAKPDVSFCNRPLAVRPKKFSLINKIDFLTTTKLIA